MILEVICMALQVALGLSCSSADEILPDMTGWFSQYAEGPTVATLEYRQAVGDLPAELDGFDGFIAVSDCGRIGDVAWLSANEGPWLRTVVFDCAGNDGTPEWMAENNIIGELDYYSVLDLDLVGQGGIQGRIIWESET